LILPGGVGLGAYQAGAYARLHEQEALRPNWLTGSSIGAVNAAVIAGTPPRDRTERLRQLWRYDTSTDTDRANDRLFAPWRHLENWASAIGVRIAGSTGHFRPRTPSLGPFKSFYDLGPLRARLETLVDFDRLNSGDIRVSVATTDIESEKWLCLTPPAGIGSRSIT